MNKILFNNDKKLRNGWWILIFIAFIALTRFAYGPVKHGLTALGVTETGMAPLAFGFILLVTWTCTLLRGESLGSVGLSLNRRWWMEVTWGTLAGIAMIFLVVAGIWAIGGVSIELDPERSVQLLAYGFYLFLAGALFEELLHRGFMFQRLIAGIGFWPAQLAIAALFASGHWGNPGMDNSTLFWASLELALGSIVLGLAYYRTKSLALPLGLHLGWNWAQGNLLGFEVSGFDQHGWFQPILLGQPEWLTGGSFGPEASVFAVLVDVIVIALLLTWRGARANQPKELEVSAPVPAAV